MSIITYIFFSFRQFSSLECYFFLLFLTKSSMRFRNVTGTAYKSAFFGRGTGSVAMSQVNCNGSEVSLLACPADMTGGVNCDHSHDAGVSCSGKT